MKLLLIIWAAPFLIRLSRWLALAQQKEYRLDRLLLFMRSSEGISDLLRIVPRPSDFSRSGLKRPKVTPRVLVVAATVIFIYVALVVLLHLELLKMNMSELNALVIWVGSGLLAIVGVPLVVVLAIFPSSLIATLRTNSEIQTAIQRLAARHPLIIGITGSYGKSSAKHLLAAVLSRRYSVFVTPKSFNTRYSVAHSIVEGYHEESVAILEFGAYGPGEIKALANAFIPKIALITGFTMQHIGLFRTERDIIRAKSELVTAVPGGGTIFYNNANPKTKQIVEAGDTTSKQVVAATNQDVSSGWREPQLNTLGQLFFYWGTKRIDTKLVGLHYLETLKLVAAVASSLDVPEDDIQYAFEQFVPPSSFVSSYHLKSGTVVVDDGGTSNPHGFSAALSLVKSIKQKRVVLITPGIIDLGVEEDNIHVELAMQARKIVTELWHVGTAGTRAFTKVFDKDYHVGEENLIESARLWDAETIVLLEGRMPNWMIQYIDHNKV